eukprot:gnl/Dysnectes_brevis/1295_a1451_2400.p1 GENE.gnl/Dysnectes_brevis/1295_a1451_2400~~gnl/Dysnectes_brevis/1295_a1451_2400.p1  ORF type:complete len:489 (+),score=97.48 gnl/Dysnectes_brevis/1295_a1451_2400:78-1544(+)
MSSLRSTQSINGVKVFNLSAGKKYPSWLTKAQRKQLKDDSEFRRRVELIQDLEFPSVSSQVKFSPDGAYLLCSGAYPPQFKMYDLTQLALKFKRHTDSDIIDFQFIGQDWKKLAVFEADRNIEFHGPGGLLHKLRLPAVPRTTAYDPHSANLLAAGSDSDIFRLDLVSGSFLKSWHTDADAVDGIAHCSRSGLTFVAASDGMLRAFDDRVGLVNAIDVGARGSGLTSVAVDRTGLRLAVGSCGGEAIAFDLRASEPTGRRDHHCDGPVHSVAWHTQSGTRKVVSADHTSVRVWDPTGQLFAVVQPEAALNGLTLCGHSGLILAPQDSTRVGAFYIPALGPAPRWAPFLDALSEERADTAVASQFEEYKFVSRQELGELGLSASNKIIRPYMHGFYVPLALYRRAKAATDPNAFARWQREQVTRKVEERRAERIAPIRKVVRVNAELAAKVANTEGDIDDRFKDLFENAEFIVDKDSSEYQTLHPSEKK